MHGAQPRALRFPELALRMAMTRPLEKEKPHVNLMK
jgi:hypothetical protein